MLRSPRDGTNLLPKSRIKGSIRSARRHVHLVKRRGPANLTSGVARPGPRPQGLGLSKGMLITRSPPRGMITLLLLPS